MLHKLRLKLLSLGKYLVTNEESFTSKCDALAEEPIMYHKKYCGERIKRGLFKSKTGRLINADLNGAINIMRKFMSNDNSKFINMKFELKNMNLFNPKRIEIYRDVL